jgi:NAD(P)-dependent dehydrogenase (short-subunit alcohol dehydrogenase family)
VRKGYFRAKPRRPEDVAKAIVFLIGDDFITGHMLICDGGLRFTA